MQLVIDIKNDGVTITSKNEMKKSVNYSDEYLKENWKELVMGCKGDPDYYKSEQYYNDRGEYLMEKYK